MNENEILKLLTEKINQNLFTDFDLLVAKNNQIISTLSSKKTNLFDIASLTKPICISSLILIAHQEKKIQLNQSVAEFIPFNHQKIKIIDLLNHQAGFIPYRNYEDMIPQKIIGKSLDTKKWFLEQLNQEDLEKNYHKTTYSDLGFILLGFILEEIYQAHLDEIFYQKITQPLQLKNTFFFNLNHHKKLTDSHDYPSTGFCQFRKKEIIAEVFDPRAYLLNGVSGHAGLFSNTIDIHHWLIHLKNSYLGNQNLFDQQILHQYFNFNERDLKQRKFTLGFDLKSLPASSGKYFSHKTIGHLGFTGCSFWWDIEQDFWIIFLSNRSYFENQLEEMKKFRPLLHNLIYEKLLTNK